MARILSVNVGRPEPIANRKGVSGIVKRPVAGPVAVTREGLAGDAILDAKHHGGPDQAVYLYFADDYAWWSDALGAPPAPGTFGENLTVEGVAGAAVAVGDRFAVGDCVLEATGHRMPCATLAARMNDRTFVKRFLAAGRPGAYCRVIAGGTVAAGMAVGYAPFAGAPVTVAELMALDAAGWPAGEAAVRARAAPLNRRLRAKLDKPSRPSPGEPS